MMKQKKKLIIISSLILNLLLLACHIPLLSQGITNRANPSNAGNNEKTPSIIGETEGQVPLSTPVVVEPEAPDQEQIYQQNGIEISLPSSYIVGNIEDYLDDLPDQPNSLNDELPGSYADFYENYKQDILLWAYDQNAKGEQESSLLVLKNDQFAGMPLSLLSTIAESFVGSGVEFLDQQTLFLNDREVLRLMTSVNSSNGQKAQVIYFFKDAGSLWIAGFYTDADQVTDYLMIFDEIVTSIKIVDVE